MDNAQVPKIGVMTMVRTSRSIKDETLIEMAMELAREYGPIFQLPGSGPRNIVVSGFALADEICDDQRFDKALGTGLQERRAMVGDGLFTAYTNEPNWRKAHNILLPTFSRQAMKGYMPQMLDLAGQLMLKWQRLNADDEIDVPGDMTRLTLDTIGLCGFDYRFNSFYRTDQHPFVAAMVDSLAKATERLGGRIGAGGHPLAGAVIEALTRWIRPSHAEGDAASSDPELRHDRDVMNALVDEVIRVRKAGGPEAIAAHHDLLSYMLTGVDKQTGERLDDLNIRYQILTFLVAGHETTSGLLSFALYFLLKHPDVLARAYDEVDRVLGSDLSVLPTYEQVHHLTYVSQILKESLRLWPTAPAFTRAPLQETTLGGRYHITPEDQITILTPMLHRDKSVWGDDAEEFNPDHFNAEAERARPANAFKPFGSGQRACIGREFALQEATLVLGMLLQRFELIDHTTYQLQLKQTLTIKPTNFRIKVRPRTVRSIVAPAPATTSAPAEPVAAVPATAEARPDGAHDTPLLVLFGSNLGTAEDLAHQIAHGGTAHGFAATVASLDDYTDKLPAAGAVVIVTSSYNGTPPDNAARFCAWLRDDALARDVLHGVRYTVFGCGNHEWTATFQAIPHLIDTEMERHGAQRFYPRGEGDAAGDFDDDFQTWYHPLWKALAQALAIKAAVTETAAASTTAVGSLYTVERVSAPVNPLIAAYGVKPLKISVNRELQKVNGARPPERSTRHIEVVLPEGVTYRTGDHLGVLPRNGPALLQRVLDHYHLAGDAYIRIHRNGTGTPALPLDQPIAVLDLLSRYVELQEVASRAQIAVLADYIESPQDKERLLALADDAHYQQEILARRITVLDLLETFPSCVLPFHAFLELLHPLRVRYYSISSSPLADAHRCSITVAVVDAPARSGHGTYQGICSSYLTRHPADSVIDAFIRSPHMAFQPPEDTMMPIVMIGPGTGIAPFRGFLQERAARQATGDRLGTALLFFGCRHPEQDYIYKDELEAFAAQGVVTLYPAFSRLEGRAKTYVQDMIKEHADEVWQLIQEGAIIYVSGDGGKMEPDVRGTLTALCQERAGVSAQEAEAWQAELRDKQRYLADVWARG